jgi:DNA-binding NtrC family response regulator
MSHALIVDDDADAASSLKMLVASDELTVAVAHSLRDARRQIALQQPDIVLLDLMLPDGNGMDLFADVDEVADSEIVLITGHASLDTSIQALRLGAADYLTKPLNIRQLKNVLARVTPPGELKTRIAALEKDVSEVGRFGRIWGRSPAMQEVYRHISRVAGTAVNVLVTGESGTGKEFVAQTIHDLSRRRDRPFLAVNCGAISPQLIESEMFGHEKGSFTAFPFFDARRLITSTKIEKPIAK